MKESIAYLITNVDPGEDPEIVAELTAYTLHVEVPKTLPGCTYSTFRDRGEFEACLREFDCPDVEEALTEWDGEAHPVAAVHIGILDTAHLN